jgi:ATP-dependent DNA helicase PIF1
MRDAVLRLERLGDETRRRFERDHRHETWFQKWDAIAESAQVAEAADEEDASL